MKLNIKIYLNDELSEWDIEYPTQNKISFPVDPGDRKIKINKIALNDIETNIFYNTSFCIDDSVTVLTSVHEITKKGIFTLQLDDLYILSHRSNHWHCSPLDEDYVFQYEFTNDSFTNLYRARDHKDFEGEFVPCFGCSNTYGQYQSETDAWPHLLSEKTGIKFLNMGVNGIGIDGIYNNLRLLHKNHNFDKCLILLPIFERRTVNTKIDQLNCRLPSTVDISGVASDFHFFNDKRIRDNMEKVNTEIINDINNTYSKEKLHDLLNYCEQNSIDLSVSSWVDEVYEYLQQQRDKINFTMLPRFTKFSLFTERADDGEHPHRKHYEDFANEIVKTL